MLHSPFLVILLCVTCSCSFYFASPLLLTSVPAPISRSLLPSHLIKRRVRSLRSTNTAQADVSNLVYEVTDDGFLIGPNTNFNLRTGTRAVSAPHETLMRTIELNCKPNRSLSSNIHMRKGGGYTIVYINYVNAAICVWGRGLFLEPLDEARFPSVFVNTLPTSASSNVNIDMRAPLITREDLSELRAETPDSSATLGETKTCHKFRVEVVFDNTYCTEHPNSTEAETAVNNAIKYANCTLQEYTCHSIELVNIDAHCDDSDDPYGVLEEEAGQEDAAKTILSKFKEIWNNIGVRKNQDLIFFFSGFMEKKSTKGSADEGRDCKRPRFGWIGKGRKQVLVHELGHTLGATHTAKGIMRDPAPMTSSDTFFSEGSQREIREYLDGCATTSTIPTASASPTPTLSSTLPRITVTTSPSVTPKSVSNTTASPTPSPTASASPMRTSSPAATPAAS